MRNYNKEELEQWILVENQTYEEIGRRLGVTGVAIKKAAKRLGIELPVRRYKNDSEHFNKKDKPKRYCIVCGKPLVGYQEKYCSKECQFTYQYNESIRKWKNGEWDGTVAFKPSNIIRRYMLEKYNYKCSKCGWGEVNPYTNLVPLQIHHVDGNSTNNKEENLEVLCPNCHSLTENFGSRNTNTPEGKSAYYCKGSSSSAE